MMASVRRSIMPGFLFAFLLCNRANVMSNLRPTLEAELGDVEGGEADSDEGGDAEDEGGPVGRRHREVGVDPLPTLLILANVEHVVLQTQLPFEKGQLAHFAVSL